MRLAAGVKLGPYEVLGLIGAGGMAEVYRARDTRLGREVAVKVVSEALGGDGAFVERFEREAKLAGSVNHPIVVALYRTCAGGSSRGSTSASERAQLRSFPNRSTWSMSGS